MIKNMEVKKCCGAISAGQVRKHNIGHGKEKARIGPIPLIKIDLEISIAVTPGNFPDTRLRKGDYPTCAKASIFLCSRGDQQVLHLLLCISD
ncbi:MAG: hypothetical protein KIT80_07035 [Chitinophagaceae bacterium]|nr:hypothetical protein [Chitinophagaceae bacterium]MCW5926653.1 hypothetical protein [Chitinophagaceae bacterium]